MSLKKIKRHSMKMAILFITPWMDIYILINVGIIPVTLNDYVRHCTGPMQAL